MAAKRHKKHINKILNLIITIGYEIVKIERHTAPALRERLI